MRTLRLLLFRLGYENEMRATFQMDIAAPLHEESIQPTLYGDRQRIYGCRTVTACSDHRCVGE